MSRIGFSADERPIHHEENVFELLYGVKLKSQLVKYFLYWICVHAVRTFSFNVREIINLLQKLNLPHLYSNTLQNNFSIILCNVFIPHASII